MANKTPSENNTVMDYAEHDRTYHMFLTGAKWMTVASVALLIAMALGFFAGFGLFGGMVAFVVLLVLAYFFA